MTQKVQWPAKVVSEEGDDLSAPLVKLLRRLKLNGIEEQENGAAAGVIESTTLEITKQAEGLIKWAGGAGVTVAGLTSLWAALSENTPLAIALVISAAVVLAASMIGLARIIDGDVRGRAAVTTEQVRARASVANAFIGEAGMSTDAAVGEEAEPGSPTTRADFLAALTAFPGQVEVKTEQGWSPVVGIESSPRGLRFKLASGDIVLIDEVEAFRNFQT
jgi:hypothetical protein